MKTSGVCVQFSLRCVYRIRIEPSEKCVWKLCFGKEEYFRSCWLKIPYINYIEEAGNQILDLLF